MSVSGNIYLVTQGRTNDTLNQNKVLITIELDYK